MGFKVFIALVWLTLPLSVVLMLHSDRQRYELEGQLQAAQTQSWEAHLGDYLRQAEIEGRRVGEFDSRRDHDSWALDWREMERQRIADEQRLPRLNFSHYPQTQAALEKVQGLSGEQRKSIQSAARLRQSYVDASEALWQLQHDMDRVEDLSRYWEFQQQMGIYLNLQDYLAQMESAYRQRRSARNQLMRQTADELRHADEARREALGELQRLPACRDEDEHMTYREHLAERYRSFDLKQELLALIGPLPAGARQQ